MFQKLAVAGGQLEESLRSGPRVAAEGAWRLNALSFHPYLPFLGNKDICYSIRDGLNAPCSSRFLVLKFDSLASTCSSESSRG